jgi:2-methylcitrate dehydratase PrpD
MASGIIEYLAEGTSTKRMHPGWAAQAGLRAVALARAGFDGPRTVWEGTHGFLHGFANTVDGDWDRLVDGFGERWVAETIAFKPYACGTMIHPYIDCARRLAPRLEGPARPGEGDHLRYRGRASCTAVGAARREARAAERYAAKFSVPFCVSYALRHGFVGLEAFTDANARPRHPRARLQGRLPRRSANPYPNEYTGHCASSSPTAACSRKAAAPARRPSRAAHARGDRGEVPRQLPLRRLGRRAGRAWLAFAPRAFDVIPDARSAGMVRDPISTFPIQG